MSNAWRVYVLIQMERTNLYSPSGSGSIVLVVTVTIWAAYVYESVPENI